MLSRGELRCIGATTLMEYKKYIEKDAAFERRFQQINVCEPTVDDTLYILRGIKEKDESHYGLTIMDSALTSAAHLSKRYINSRFLPDKAIDLLDEACASLYVQKNSQPEEIEQLERKIKQLSIEQIALEREVKELSEHLKKDDDEEDIKEIDEETMKKFEESQVKKEL